MISTNLGDDSNPYFEAILCFKEFKLTSFLSLCAFINSLTISATVITLRSSTESA